MKAINNTTGEIVDIEDMSIVTYRSSDGTWVKTLIKNFTFLDAEKDYYTKLEHQYAGMAMQGILSNYELYREIAKSRNLESAIMEYASDLVKRLKEKEESK